MFKMNINDIATVNGGINPSDFYLRRMKTLIERGKRKAQEEQQKKELKDSMWIDITK